MVVIGLQPVIGEFQEFLDRAAAMIAGNGFVQVPPDPFDGIGFWRVLGQEVQLYPLSGALEILPHQPAIVKRGVITDHMDRAVTTQAMPQVVQMCDKQFRVAACGRRTHQQRSGAPDQRSGQVSLDVIARRFDGCLLTFEHPTGTDLGIQVQINFILKHRHFVGRQVVQQPANSSELACVLGVRRPDGGPGPAQAKPKQCKLRRTVSPLTRIPCSSHNSSANNSQVQRLRK